MPHMDGGDGGGAITGAALAAVLVQNEVPTGAIDGANTTYTTAAPFIAGSLQVYLNGDLLRVTDDYTVAGGLDGFTTVIAPRAGDKVTAVYIKAA